MDYYRILNKNVIKVIESLKKEKLYFNQISGLTGIKSKNNLLKNLDSLVKLKILIKEKNKSNTFYNINYDNFFSLILLQIINIAKFQNLPFERRKPIEELINKMKPLMIILFGSTAKENYKKESDIDLLLIFNTKPKNIEEISEISSKYGIKLNPIILKFSEININDDTIKHIFLTGYPIIGHNYFYEVFKNV